MRNFEFMLMMSHLKQPESSLFGSRQSCFSELEDTPLTSAVLDNNVHVAKPEKAFFFVPCLKIRLAINGARLLTRPDDALQAISNCQQKKL